jgi:hypothetical protein
VHHATSLPPVRVDLPPLQAGAAFLERWAVREVPAVPGWRAEHYDSVAPATFVLRDALVHSSAGLIALGQDIVAETLGHILPHRHRYRVAEGGIVLQTGEARRLAGTHISVLAGAGETYFHAMVEGVMRLAMVPPYLLGEAAGVLHSAGVPVGRAALGLMGLPPGVALRAVADGETLLVERLVLPLSTHGMFLYHPCLTALFDRMSAAVPGPESLPVRIYLDRRGSALRRLVNEDEVVDALRPMGFVPVRPEALSLADQVRLFRGARAIVAPHGSGLTNLGFCRPGCAVLELHMDAYVHWCFRNLAAVRGLAYDCVLGRAVGDWGEVSSTVHAARWVVSVQHVMAAASAMA